MNDKCSWVVRSNYRYPQYKDNVDVVFAIHWKCAAVFSEHSGVIFGSQLINNSSESFTPYEDLSKNQVINWVKQALLESGVLTQKQET